jgi:hypothetical protein
VSHWAVNSEAIVGLITKAFDEFKVDPGIGRAEALRRSIVVLMNRGGAYAHPANWAPFVVVGEALLLGRWGRTSGPGTLAPDVCGAMQEAIRLNNGHGTGRSITTS